MNFAKASFYSIYVNEQHYDQTCLCLYHLTHPMTKPTKWHVHPAKTQISLGIHPVWSESSLSSQRNIGPLLWTTYWAHSEDWSDWVNAQADLSLHWVHMSFCWFCRVVAHLRTTKMQINLHSLISIVIIRSLDSARPIDDISKISSLLLASAAEQATFSLITFLCKQFFMTWLICKCVCNCFSNHSCTQCWC